MNEYILVEFFEVREVFIDGNASGYQTGDVIEIEAGIHTIRLGGDANYLPLEQDINPSGTSPIQAEIFSFSKA